MATSGTGCNPMRRWSYVNGAWRRYGETPIAISVSNVMPTAANTGYSGTLTTHSGDITVTTAGTIIENLDVYGVIKIQAANVIVRNNRVRGNSTGDALIDCRHVACSGAYIHHNTLLPDTKSTLWNGIIGHDYNAEWNNISGCVDAFGVYNNNSGYQTLPTNVFIRHNYAHGAWCWSPDPSHTDNKTHNDAVQIQGGGYVTIECNNFDWAPMAGSYAGIDCTSAIMITPNVSPCPGNIIRYNWFNGSGIAAVINISAKSAGPTTTAAIFFNRFSRSNTGYLLYLDTDLTFEGMPTSTGLDNNNGNVYDDNDAKVTVYRLNI